MIPAVDPGDRVGRAAIAEWVAVGCYANPASRRLFAYPPVFLPQAYPSLCLAHCNQNGFFLAGSFLNFLDWRTRVGVVPGLELSQCYCGNETELESGELCSGPNCCNTSCNGHGAPLSFGVPSNDLQHLHRMETMMDWAGTNPATSMVHAPLMER